MPNIQECFFYEETKPAVRAGTKRIQFSIANGTICCTFGGFLQLAMDQILMGPISCIDVSVIDTGSGGD
jgi:hypothetical protein